MKEGEIVRYDFEVYADETLIDTSIEDRAKEHEIFSEDAEYQPQLIISGIESQYPGLKDAIIKAEEGGEAEVEVEPKDAFGERKPRNLDYRRYADIARIANQQEKEVERGVKLDFDGRTGIITLITPARVRIDFNHEYAGKKITSKVKIIEILKEKEDIIESIFRMNVGTSQEFEFSEEDGVLDIKVPSAVSLGLDWANVKLIVVGQLRKHTGIKNIRYIEEFFQKTDVKTGDYEEGGEESIEVTVSEGEAREEVADDVTKTESEVPDVGDDEEAVTDDESPKEQEAATAPEAEEGE